MFQPQRHRLLHLRWQGGGGAQQAVEDRKDSGEVAVGPWPVCRVVDTVKRRSYQNVPQGVFQHREANIGVAGKRDMWRSGEGVWIRTPGLECADRSRQG